jgi:hypothetical protein
MVAIGIDTLIDYISTQNEFLLLEEISKVYEVDCNILYDYALDRYNYHVKNNLDPLGAKIFCLDETINEIYKIVCYRTKLLEPFTNHNEE